MPGTIPEYKPNDKATNADGDAERVKRQAYVSERWMYYDGDHFKWLKKEKGAKRDDNITLNLCGRSVDKAVEFIGTPERFELPDSGEGEGEVADVNANPQTLPAQAVLDALYEQYECETPELIQSGLVAGHTFVKLYWDNDNHPAMTLIDPQYMTVFWDEMNTKQVLFYRMQWQRGETNYRQDIVPDWLLLPPDEGEDYTPIAQHWLIIDYKQERNSDWKTFRQQVWEFSFPPIVDWPFKKRPHQYYGASFLHNSIQLNDALNFVASNTARIIKHHAHPKDFAFGFIVPDMDEVGGVVDNIPVDAKVQRMEMAGDLMSSMNFIDLIRAEFFANQRVIDLNTQKDKVGALTNFGVRMMYSDQVEMTEEARKSIGLGLGRVFQCLLLMSGIHAPEPPFAEWGDPLPSNRLEELQAAAIEQKLGTTSTKTLAESIGRDYDVEKQNKADEGATAGNQLVDILNFTQQRSPFGVSTPQPAMNGNNPRMPMAT